MVRFSTMLLMRYGGALRCVTFMRYGVSRWRVTAVYYGAFEAWPSIMWTVLSGPDAVLVDQWLWG